MIRWMKKSRKISTSTTQGAAVADQGEEEEKSTSQSNMSMSVEAEMQPDRPPPDLEELDRERLTAVLQVDPDTTGNTRDLIRKSVGEHFPSLPPEGDGVLTAEELERHLYRVKLVVHDELQRLNELIKKYKNLSGVMCSYHRHTLDHAQHTLLPIVSSSQQAFVLMKWLCHDYFSEGFLGHPDFRETNHRRPLDMHLYSEAVVSVGEKLLSTLKTDVQKTLREICQRQESEFWRSRVFHMDVIQCINEPIEKAKAISETMQQSAWRVSLLQLQEFLERFNLAKQQLTKKYKKTPLLVVETCLKTLDTCHGLVTNIQLPSDGEARSQTLSTLESLETSARAAMEDALAELLKDHLKRHFQTNTDTFLLMEIKEMLRDGEYSPDVQKRFLELLDERVTALYLWNLHTFQKKLQKRGGVAQEVTRDAELLLQTFSSDLHPGLSLHVLLKVEELLVSQDVDSVKLTIAGMIPLCQTEKVKQQLPHLLRLTHLTDSQRQEVREAVFP